MKSKTFPITPVLITLFLISCASTALAESAAADLRGTAEDSSVHGKVIFTETPEGLRIDAEVHGAPAGDHGFHVHDFGSCADQGKAAGGHYNPAGVRHGNLAADGLDHAHAGDFGNITIDEDGSGKLTRIIPGLSISGSAHPVAGRAVILHENPDDFGQPTGNAGSRIGCGPIVIVNAEV